MIRILILFLCLLVLQVKVRSQEAALYLDSLSKLKEAPSDSVIILELNKVAALARLEKDENTLSKTLLYLGSYYYNNDILNYAAVVSESVEVVKRDSSLKSWIVSSVYNNLASLEKAKENYLLANDYFLKAIEIEKNGSNDARELATLYSNISYNYSQLGDYNNSLDFIERAITYTSQSSNSKDKKILSKRLSKAGKIYFDSGDYVAALDKYTQAQDILDVIDIDKSSKIFINNIQRIVEINLHNNDISNIEDYLFLLNNSSKRNSYRFFRTLYLNGEYQKALGNTELAIVEYNKAIKMLSGETVQSEEFSFLQYVYKLKAKALYEDKQFVKSLESTHAGLQRLDEKIKSNYLQNPDVAKYDNYPIAKELLLLKARSAVKLASSEGAAYEAIANQAYMDLCHLFNVMKGAYLSEGSKYFVSENAQPIYEEIIEELSRQYKVHQSQEILDKLIYVMQANKSTILFSAIKRKVEILASDIPVDQINKEIELRNQKLYYEEILCKEELEPLVDSNLINSLKSEIFELNESLEIHDKKMTQHYPSITKETVTELEKFQKLVSRKPTSQMEFEDLLDLSKFLGSSLLQKLSDKSIENLYVIPDGIFSKIPFEALSVNGDYAVQNLNVSYFLSPQQFVDSKVNEVVDKPSMYGLAPDFTTSEDNENRILPKGLQNLPFAKEEVEFLGNLFDTKVKSDSTTYTTDLINHSKEYSIIHLATHAIVNEVDPMLSEIYFNDGALTVFDIQGLNIKPEFVMLSACNTAVGADQKGEGVISLSRGFFQAGVESIQSSLWPLDDYSSSEIIKAMYGYLKKGEEKSVALKKAKIKYLSNADVLRSHPYYWAGIVQIGNNGALFSSSNYNFVWFLALFLVLAFVLFYMTMKSKNRI